MSKVKNFASSSLARKYIMALSGAGLLVFIILHLAGNLLLYKGTGDAFNLYAESMEKWGPLLNIAEFGLFLVFLVHIIYAVLITQRNRNSRGSVRYRMVRSKGGVSRYNKASTSMIFTGIALLVFTVFHVWHIKLGPGQEQGYVAFIQNQPVRDLHRLVVEVFHNPFYVLLYVGVMVLLGMHLRHGFWSWLQSLGTMAPRYSLAIYGAGFFFAVLIATGFAFIPIWIYFDVHQLFLG